MSARISLPRKQAQILLDYLDGGPRAVGSVAIGALRFALRPSPKRKAAKATRRKVVAKKKATKGLETKLIRGEVMARANGRCEHCTATDRYELELDHKWGRGKVRQSVENCWALCRSCHRQKTENIPSSVYWLKAFRRHSEIWAYASEEAKADAKIEAEELMVASETVGTP